MSCGPSTIDQILSEAQERAQQIIMLGTQEAASLTARLVALGRAKVEEQFGQLTRHQLALARIAHSEVINHHRMLKIQTKHDLCQRIFQQVQVRLASISAEQGEEYRFFLVQTIADGLVRMFEEIIRIRCREVDRPLLNELIPLCRQTYHQYMQEQIGIDFPIELDIADNLTLQPRSLQPYRPVEKREEDGKCIGGVILADGTGNITFKATFDSRLAILKEICLPEVREGLWGSGVIKGSGKESEKQMRSGS